MQDNTLDLDTDTSFVALRPACAITIRTWDVEFSLAVAMVVVL